MAELKGMEKANLNGHANYAKMLFIPLSFFSK